MFEEMVKKELTKAHVDENMSELEAKYTDYKLVRGICHLLEKRCIYASPSNFCSHSENNDNPTSAVHFRRKIFEESSQVGYPITEYERKSILQKIVSKYNLSIDELEIAMWSDLDKNKHLKNFDSLSPLQLVAWYNLSVLQTLLLSCVKLEFTVYGGLTWKKILRRVKQLGLMYFLHYGSNNFESDSNGHTKDNKHLEVDKKNNKGITCTVDGPLNIVKMTDRYGMAMAKLIPLIIFTEIWSIDAVILRKSISGIKKTYSFHLSNTDKDVPLFDASNIHFQPEVTSEPRLAFNSFGPEDFDSNVEKKFMDKFVKFSIGWKLIREPDPLILSDGKAFIPDFVFEKYGIKVYLEIVGFWTKEYLKRKLEKIKDLFTISSTTSSSPLLPSSSKDRVGIDMLIAANIDNHVSEEDGDKIRIDSIFSKFIDKKHLIFFKKDEIPFGPIIEYLKDIDSKMIEHFSINSHDVITKEIENIIQDKQNKVIFLEKISEKHNIPLESVLKSIKKLQSNNENSKEAKTNRLKEFLLVDNYIISNEKINELLPKLDKIKKLQDAIKFLSENDIPEECVTALISKIGFEIIWNGIDFNNALIQRQLMNK
jgi:predicted nuclease of restriction endonuclease-like RecB superfamily